MPLHPKTPSSLASFKSRLVLPFWYRLTQVVLEKRPINGCSSSSSSIVVHHCLWRRVHWPITGCSIQCIAAARAAAGVRMVSWADQRRSTYRRHTAGAVQSVYIEAPLRLGRSPAPNELHALAAPRPVSRIHGNSVAFVVRLSVAWWWSVASSLVTCCPLTCHFLRLLPSTLVVRVQPSVGVCGRPGSKYPQNDHCPRYFAWFFTLNSLGQVWRSPLSCRSKFVVTWWKCSLCGCTLQGQSKS